MDRHNGVSRTTRSYPHQKTQTTKIWFQQQAMLQYLKSTPESTFELESTVLTKCRSNQILTANISYLPAYKVIPHTDASHFLQNLQFSGTHQQYPLYSVQDYKTIPLCIKPQCYTYFNTYLNICSFLLDAETRHRCLGMYMHEVTFLLREKGFMTILL